MNTSDGYEAARKAALAAIERAENEARECVEYRNERLLVVDEKRMAELREVAADLDAEAMRLFGENAASSVRFWGLANLLNPLRPAKGYSLFSKHNYRMVKDQQKAIPRLPKQLAVWKNTALKRLDEALAESPEMPEAEREALVRRIEEEYREAKEAVYDILENPHRYEVWITDYEKGRRYPFATLSYGSGPTETKLLRQGVPNFLWIADPSPGTGEALKGMRNLFGDVYVKELA